MTDNKRFIQTLKTQLVAFGYVEIPNSRIAEIKATTGGYMNTITALIAPGVESKKTYTIQKSNSVIIYMKAV